MIDSGFQIGDTVSWQSCGKGKLESIVVAWASSLSNHVECVAVAVHWGEMWIATSDVERVSGVGR